MDIIIVNPHAKRLRDNTHIRAQVHRLFDTQALIIDVDERHNVINALDALERTWTPDDSIYVVGGDGTFNDILNWIVSMPSINRPAFMSVGGGQFCYMTRFHGLHSKDPIRNLERILSGRLLLKRQTWEPLRVEDSLTRTVRHGAVIANGVISDIQQWYENVGKGGILQVIRLVLIAIASVAFDFIRRWHGRIKLTKGTLVLGTQIVKPKAFVGVTFSAIPELLSSCRPFKGRPNHYEFFAVAYWGGLKLLGMAAPFIWFGKMPFWIRRRIFNQPIRSAAIISTDARLVIDGDLHIWPDSTRDTQETRTVRVSTGESIELLCVTSSSGH